MFFMSLGGVVALIIFAALVLLFGVIMLFNITLAETLAVTTPFTIWANIEISLIPAITPTIPQTIP